VRREQQRHSDQQYETRIKPDRLQLRERVEKCDAAGSSYDPEEWPEEFVSRGAKGV
jgi:hypothetical protein